ncbi:MAG TPA: LPS assembly lipoprotein LptE [Phycisphaerae bacterium]|nr:LPS assembly lipoprotein LptE [Phycisphaerae bacterium]HPS53929.1 LPS assembly lipoprotein LptE [Phycisphaerae bacterium]
MNKKLLTVVVSCVVASFAALSGCSSDPNSGYTGKSMYRTNIKTVAVPMATRGEDVYRRENEMRLTEALVKRIELNTPYKVTVQSRADTTLTCSIEQINQAVLSYNPDTGDPRDISVTFVVAFKWVDNRTGKILAQEKNYPITGTYISDSPFNEKFFQGSETVINKVAERIVEHMERDW